VANHYLGSWESYSYRRDARWNTSSKGKENYDGKATQAKTEDNSMIPWLDGFIQHHGFEKASDMLKGVGVLEPRPASQDRH